MKKISLLFAALAAFVQFSATKAAGAEVRVTLDFSSDEFTAKNFYIYNEDLFLGGSVSKYLGEDGKTITLTDLAPGTYTVFASFEEIATHYYTGWAKYYVFAEDQELAGGSEITLSVSDCRNRFIGRSYLPGGEVAELDNYLYDPSGSGEYSFVEGNIDKLYVQTTIYDSKYDAYIVSSVTGCGTYNMDNYYAEGINWRLEEKENFYINDISDRFVICQQRQNYTGDGLMATSAFSKGLSCLSLENVGTEYVSVSEKFAHTPAFDVYGGEGTMQQNSCFGYGDTSYFPHWMLPWAMDATPSTLHYSASANAADFPEIHPMYGFSLNDVRHEYTDYVLKGQRMVFSGTDGAYVFSNFSSPSEVSGIIAIGPDGNEIYAEYPGHPLLSVPFDCSGGYTYGNSAPVNTVNPQIYKTESGFVTAFAPEYHGLMGEIREADLIDIVPVACLNGVETADRESWNAFWSNIPSDPTSDRYTARFANASNVCVDGMKGFNRTDLEFCYSGDDPCPPVIQAFQLRDTENCISQHFNTIESARVYICVADYEWGENDEAVTYIYESRPVTMKVEIALHGAENPEWIDIPVDNISEYDNLAGYGRFFACNGQDVTAATKAGWYDIRITVTDMAGNTNVQEFGPAFELEQSSGMNTLPAYDPANDNMDSATVWRTYGIDGAFVKEMTGSAFDTSGLNPGIYIIRISSSAGEKTMKISVK
ncbi:MAG: T9SS type A sorting domain-containing protein [Muribaculaceae bacterium]|nr:T9SS type A sorting domain-containing protein [Muribaculaceae bacterium]